LSKVTEVCLGLDPSTKLLGWCFVGYHSGDVLWNGVTGICEPSGGWRSNQIHKVVGGLKQSLANQDDDYAVRCIGIERMYVGPSKKVSMELSYVAGQVHQEVSGVFPEAEILRFLPPEWREECGMPKTTSKAALWSRASEFGLSTTEQDAIDAGFIAFAARSRHRKIPAAPPSR